MSTEPSRPWFYGVVFSLTWGLVTTIFWGSYGALLGILFTFTRPGEALNKWLQSAGAGSLMEVLVCLTILYGSTKGQPGERK